MKDFLKNHGLWILFAGAVIAVALALLSYFSTNASPLVDLANTITSPFRAVCTSVSGWFTDKQNYYEDVTALKAENEALKKQIAEMEATVRQGDRVLTESEATGVIFRPAEESELRAYIATGEPMDKAGSYGVQGKGALLVERLEGDFFNVISFLESRPRNTTAVALENTIVSEITYDNFSAYFREKPAKIMSLLQHMSARMRQMQKAYVDTCHALEVYGDKAKLAAEHGEWTDSHNRTYNLLKAMFPSVYHEEEK